MVRKCFCALKVLKRASKQQQAHIKMPVITFESEGCISYVTWLRQLQLNFTRILK